MKVAFLVYQFPSLSETFILNQITGLIDRGCEVHIYARSRANVRKVHADVARYRLLERTRVFNPIAFPRSRILRAISRLAPVASGFIKNPSSISRWIRVVRGSWRAASLDLLRKSLPFLDRGRYDIVHCQFGPNGILATRLREIGALEGKIITHFRGADSSAFVRTNGANVYQELFDHGDLFLCVSENIKEKLIKLGCSEAKILVHRSGVDLQDLLLARSRSGSGIRLLTVARLIEKKGLAYGIEAVARLVPRHPTLEYVIVGDGPLRPGLECLIRQLKLEAHVKLLGWKSRDEVGVLLREADIVLTPSVTGENGDEEGIPVAIMEAFASGLPVVSTRHAGIPEIVHDGRSGFLVPERDIDALAEKLELLISSPELRHEMGRQGRRHVEEYHNIDKLNDRLLAIYRALMNGERKFFQEPPMPRTIDGALLSVSR